MVEEKVVVFTSVYPEGVKYFSDAFTSITQQTNTMFDLWIGCDRISRNEILDAIGRDLNATWIESKTNESSIILRERAFIQIIHKYPVVIFVDSDDILENTRVEAAVESLKYHDVYGCAMKLIDQNGKKIDTEFRPTTGWDISSLLPKTNIFGLSNTAYRTDMLKNCLPFRADCELLDWFIATKAWFQNATFDFDMTPRMLYRQHPNNIARILPPFSGSQILTATNRVLHHYQCILQDDSMKNSIKRDKVENANNYVKSFHQSITNSSDTLNEYVKELNHRPFSHIWWSCVAHPHLEGIWRT